ncbi:LL-diaminopimelate aminotransferase [Parvularcula sp. LCG005]|uniref:LL-diaminopimelate aminotransferase n=1 Tax=Parvularcula sp. LCG005 TaxID=3078805 RepID=UPI002942776F|nr:LL-diaminopimelate aminotransferase [Parvularcula sp. LCG005]WOI53107.1 LL-diaminopimelate aminotransferase [Parvularcula sp. LCG005]
MQDFHAIRRLPPYVFAEVNRQKAEARAVGRDVIDLGMGNPDLPTPSFIVDKLCEASRNPKAHGYSASKGIPGLRKAQARYYERRFGVKLDPESEVIVTLGSKEGFANMANAITAPGDVILAPNPSYPLHAFGFIMAGGSMRALPSAATEQVFIEAEKAIKYSVPKPIAMVLNYPSNPTAEIASLDFYRDAVAFARKHELIILSDLAYSEIYFDTDPSPSILQVNGAKDVAVEFTTMSKTFSMAGWRMGFAVGNPRLISALTRVKSYLDYGAFTPIQVAAATALDRAEEVGETMRQVYRKRLDVLVDSFRMNGWDIPRPKASMFAWAPIPSEYGQDSLAFTKHLIDVGDVAVAPGVGFGERGEGFVRIALVENEQRIRQAAKGVGRLLKKKAA